MNDVTYTIDTPCHDWEGFRFNNGYGAKWVRQADGTRLKKLVHRLVWESAHGPIPSGLVVMHLCDNRACCRLDHLRVGTQAENLADMRAKGRGRSKPVACRMGHLYEEHARIDSWGRPCCRICARDRQREKRHGQQISR